MPIFPRFSRAAGEGRFDDIKRDFKTGVVSLWLISIPILVLMILYTEPLIRLIFQHGKFDANSTRVVSLALIFQAFQIIPYFARDSITRVFYAFQDSRTPLMVGLIAIVIKAALNWFLVPRFGVGGITFSITLITFINMTLLGILSKKHIKDLGFTEMVAPFFKLLLAAAVMAAVCKGVEMGLAQTGLEQGLASMIPGKLGRFLPEYLLLALAALAGCGMYVALGIGLKVSEAEYLKERLLGRFFKKKEA